MDIPAKLDNELPRRSVERFMMQHIYPKLKAETQKTIDGHIASGVSVTGAFEFAGVKSWTCIR